MRAASEHKEYLTKRFKKRSRPSGRPLSFDEYLNGWSEELSACPHLLLMSGLHVAAGERYAGARRSRKLRFPWSVEYRLGLGRHAY